jgi:hypothetical protein
LTINNSDQFTDIITACNSYTWIDGVTYTASNTSASQTFTNVMGCDSVINLNLTINTTQFGTEVVSACNTYTWINGVTYTANNTTAKDTLISITGCDSIVTLNLTILYPSSGIEVVTACDSYYWNGVMYTSSTNNVLDTLVNSVGCDSIVTLDLTILNSTYSTEVITACDSYIWNGIVYVSSTNSPTKTLINTVGCDSIVTLNLTILKSSTFTDVITSCDEITWIDGITYDQTTNGLSFNLINSHGCDSIVVLSFTLLEVDTVVNRNHLTLTAQASNATYQWIDCDADTAITNATDAEFIVIKSGSYKVEITQNGCVDTSKCFSFTNVGLVDLNITQQIKVYPNPVREFVNIELINWSIQKVEIIVRDITGKKIYIKEIEPVSNEEGVSINTAKWAKGIYFIEVSDGLNQIVEKIVVQ